jgi:hypothetical protein
LLIGVLFALTYFDVPIIKTEAQVVLLLVNLLVLFAIVTFSLYFLSFIYFPVSKILYYLLHCCDQNPFGATGKMDQDTKKLYDAAIETHKKASKLRANWRFAVYVKRSRLLKILTALGCGGVVFAKGYLDSRTNIHAIFEMLNLFTEEMSTGNTIALCAILVGFVLVTYFFIWLTFYFSDAMILATHIRLSVVWKCSKIEKKFYTYWRENDEIENERYWNEVRKHAKESEEFEHKQRLSNFNKQTASEPPDYIIVPKIDVSDM